jgi:protein-S-isoprenylcysteine O-methyltransferase Ste14
MKDYLTDWGERAIIVLLFASFAVSNLRSADWSNYLLVLLEAANVVFILIRRRAVSVSDRPLDWGLAVAGTMAPLLARPETGPVLPALASALIIAGTAISFSAKASLNRRFGMTPANRGVQANWIYALVRHPMYLGYIVAQSGYLLHNPSLRNVGVYGAAWCLQVARIWREERHLSEDPAYRTYATRVRFRLIPGVF